MVEQLRFNAAHLHEDRERIEREIEAINSERQAIITLARKKSITTTDMEQQLATLTLQEVNLKHELSSLGQAININALDNWEAKFAECLADLQVGMDELKNAAPQDDEERHNLFLLKKRVVDTLVERVTINKDREIMVEIRLNLFEILDQDTKSENFATTAYSKRVSSAGLREKKKREFFLRDLSFVIEKVFPD